MIPRIIVGLNRLSIVSSIAIMIMTFIGVISSNGPERLSFLIAPFIAIFAGISVYIACKAAIWVIEGFLKP